MNIFNLKNNIKINNSLSGGLTMVESLVAISILTIAVIGPLGIIAQALKTSYYTRDQMTAHYLAQEAVEYVINMRDKRGLEITRDYLRTPETPLKNWLTDDPDITKNTFGTGLTINSVSLVADRYYLTRDVATGGYTFTKCILACELLRISQNGVFGDTLPTATSSVFTREVYLQRVSPGKNPQEIVITANVYWKNGSYPAKVTVREYLTNWPSRNGL